MGGGREIETPTLDHSGWWFFSLHCSATAVMKSCSSVSFAFFLPRLYLEGLREVKVVFFPSRRGRQKQQPMTRRPSPLAQRVSLRRYPPLSKYGHARVGQTYPGFSKRLEFERPLQSLPRARQSPSATSAGIREQSRERGFERGSIALPGGEPWLLSRLPTCGRLPADGLRHEASAVGRCKAWGAYRRREQTPCRGAIEPWDKTQCSHSVNNSPLGNGPVAAGKYHRRLGQFGCWLWPRLFIQSQCL